MEGVRKGGFFINWLRGNEPLQQEAKELYEKASQVKITVEKSFSPKGNKKFEESPFIFFENCMSQFTPSREMEYLMQGYALTTLRKAQRQDEKGIIHTCTEINWINRFSKFAAGYLDGSAHKKIIECWQKEFTAHSVSLLLEEAQKMTSFANTEKDRVLEMIASAKSKRPTPFMR